MASDEQNQTSAAVNTPTTFLQLPEGSKVELQRGAQAEVVGNPGDGAWLLVRIIDDPDDPSAVGSEELVFFTDVKGTR